MSVLNRSDNSGQTCKIKTVPILLDMLQSCYCKISQSLCPAMFSVLFVCLFVFFFSQQDYIKTEPIVLKLGGGVGHEARKTPFLDYRYLDLIVVSLGGLR